VLPESFRPSDAVALRLSAMGDVALTTGVLHWWHRTRGLRFTVVTRAAYAGLFQDHPAVVETVGLDGGDLDRWMRTCHRLAQALGEAWSQAGHWQAALVTLRRAPDATPDEADAYGAHICRDWGQALWRAGQAAWEDYDGDGSLDHLRVLRLHARLPP